MEHKTALEYGKIQLAERRQNIVDNMVNILLKLMSEIEKEILLLFYLINEERFFSHYSIYFILNLKLVKKKKKLIESIFQVRITHGIYFCFPFQEFIDEFNN